MEGFLGDMGEGRGSAAQPAPIRRSELLAVHRPKKSDISDSFGRKKNDTLRGFPEGPQP
jgi:hypothetical protein